MFVSHSIWLRMRSSNIKEVRQVKFFFVLSIALLLLAFLFIGCDDKNENGNNNIIGPGGVPGSGYGGLPAAGAWSEHNFHKEPARYRMESIGVDTLEGRECLIYEYEVTESGVKTIIQMWFDRSTIQLAFIFMKQGAKVIRMDLLGYQDTANMVSEQSAPVGSQMIGQNKYTTPTGKTVSTIEYRQINSLGQTIDLSVSAEVPFNQVFTKENGALTTSLYDFNKIGAIRDISLQEAQNAELLTLPSGDLPPGGSVPDIPGGDVPGGDVPDVPGVPDVPVVPDVPAHPFVTNGLVSYWGFNADSIAGNIAKDGWSTNNGTMIGGPRIVNGVVGNALEFDGVDDYVDCGNNNSLNITGNMSIELWLNPRDGIKNRHLVSRGQWGLSGYYLQHGGQLAGEQYIIYFFARNVYQGDIGPKDTTKVDTWQHIVLTYDGSAVKLYKDGALINSEPAKGTIKGADGKLLIGRYMAANDNYFKGTIDEVRIYNRALNVVEIMQNLLIR